MGSVIRKNKRERSFTTVSNVPLQNADLSWAAKGLLTYIMSLPEDWDLSLDDLSRRSKAGKGSTRSTLHELMEAGYVVRYETKKQGRFCYEYVADDEPMIDDRVQKLHAVEAPDRVQFLHAESDLTACSFPTRKTARPNNKTITNKTLNLGEREHEAVFFGTESSDDFSGFSEEKETYSFGPPSPPAPPSAPAAPMVVVPNEAPFFEEKGNAPPRPPQPPRAEAPPLWRRNVLGVLKAFDQFERVEAAWLEYKAFQIATYGNSYPFEAAEVGSLKKLHMAANGASEIAAAVLADNMANGYKGLVIKNAKSASKHGNGNAKQPHKNSEQRLQSAYDSTLAFLNGHAG